MLIRSIYEITLFFAHSDSFVIILNLYSIHFRVELFKALKLKTYFCFTFSIVTKIFLITRIPLSRKARQEKQSH